MHGVLLHQPRVCEIHQCFINYFLVWLLSNKKEILHTLDCHVCWFCRVVMGKNGLCATLNILIVYTHLEKDLYLSTHVTLSLTVIILISSSFPCRWHVWIRSWKWKVLFTQCTLERWDRWSRLVLCWHCRLDILHTAVILKLFFHKLKLKQHQTELTY